MSKENGGPAFPIPGLEHDSDFNGMTLRDYFAAKALQGFCANHNTFPTDQSHFDSLAEDAYRTADAMLAERSKP